MIIPDLHGSFPLVNKSDAFAVFAKFKPYVENQFSHKLKVFHSDGGGEYIGHQLQHYLSQYGVHHIKSCPHTPQQNGIAERKHKHIFETALSLLFKVS